MFFQVRLVMMKIGWLSRLTNERPSRAGSNRIAVTIGIAVLLTAGIAAAQDAPALPSGTQDGYAIHNTVDLGGHVVGVFGSGSMYDTLVNIHSGPRVLGQTFTMHALPTTKHTLFDDLTAYSSGFGGDPNNFAKMDASKGKVYEFSGMFRRDRQYFDYDLLGNPNITTGQSIPIGPSNAPTGSVAWPQVQDSPVMFNTVRRMTDVDLTIFPLSTVTFRVGYTQSIFQGPSLTPSYSIGKYDALIEEYQRNSTDDFTGAIDWKPVAHTKVTFEEQVDHYKGDSYFTLNPNSFLVQEADGTPLYLGNFDSQVAYGIGGCNTGSMGTAYTNSTTYTILSTPQKPGGRPIINAACDGLTSYLRSQPTRILYPTEILRLQSTSLKNIAMNGDFRYTKANMNLPNYYENYQGLDGAVRSTTWTGASSAQREVVALDFGVTWDATKTVSLADQLDYSDVHQPGTSNISAGVTASTTTNPNETINYSGPLSAGTATVEGNPNGTPSPAYFGQRWLTNNVTASWDVSTMATLSLTYRYRTHVIAENEYSTGDPGGNPGNVPLAVAADQNGTVTINENAGIFNAALRPTKNWDINGTAEIAYNDNAFTPLTPRQLQHYRIHTLYRPKPWATISAAYNDLERHNNTNNNQAAVALFNSQYTTTATPAGAPYDGPLDHVDHTRIISLGAALTPNEHYGFDFNYSYSDVYTSTNICYLSGATATLPGAASQTSSGGNNLCPFQYARGGSFFAGSGLSEWGPVKDFMDAPTQYASMALSLTPNKAIHADLGYRISAVSGNQFFNDAREVNGSLQSAYQSPFVNLAWTVKPGWIWRAEYNYYGYGEGGPSGAPLCSTATSATAPVVSCSSSTLPGPTGLTEPSSGLTGPRNFHANNVTLGMHYEF
jgi:hypothetical protein